MVSYYELKKQAKAYLDEAEIKALTAETLKEEAEAISESNTGLAISLLDRAMELVKEAHELENKAAIIVKFLTAIC